MLSATSRIIDSIRFRLIAAFTIVGAMAITSALYAWFSVAQTEKKMNDVVSDILPLTLHSQGLSKEVTLFAVTTGELATVTSEKELQAISEKLFRHSETITTGINSLFIHNFETLFISNLKKKVDILISNLDNHKQLTRVMIKAHKELQDSVTRLSSSQKRFLETARPRISKGYTEFLRSGKKISEDLRKVVATFEKGGERPNLKKIEDKLRIGFETLINTSAGEMRANLEMVAITFLISGILHEAANVETIDKVNTLKKRFEETQPLIARITLILSHTTPNNNRVLITSAPTLEAGKGPNSIFNLRRREISLRSLTHSSSLQAIQLSEELAKDVGFLVAASQQHAKITVDNLQVSLNRYRLFSAIAAVITIIISIGICLLYVEKRVIRRIDSLRKNMDQQANGLQPAIPIDQYGDEISDMTQTLEKFVSQREKTDVRLRKMLISLNEAQQLAKIGNCERNHTNGTWQWSTGFYHIIGYYPADIKSSEDNFWRVVHPKDKLRVELFFNTLTSHSYTSEIEFRLIASNGDIINVRGLWKLIEKGESSSFTQHGTIQDVTERKKLAEDLLKIRKMESISVLAGGIAHDFNNLLTGIIGNIALVARIIDEDHQAQEHLKLSEKAALRARNLTNRLLTFSSGGNPVRSVTYLPQILKETAEFSLSGSNVKCEYSMEEPLWPVDMDSSHINQVIQNLVVTADQAMTSGGIITITCSNQLLEEDTISNLPSGSYVKITVSDNGGGIPLEHIENIFDPYYSTKGFYSDQGSGLGLAIVHAIITKHGGIISVDSKVNQGTEFTIFLPAMPETTPEPPLKEEGPTSGSGLILIMDDEEIIRNVSKQMLIQLGYEVRTAKDGKAVIELYETLIQRGRIIDAVIMDLTIPGGMGGQEAVAKLIKKHPRAKVIASSGYTTEPVMNDFRHYGFRDIIVKPYQMKELSVVVARVVTKS